MVYRTDVGGLCNLFADSDRLWRGLRWGYWLELPMLIINLIGDIINVIAGVERRALVVGKPKWSQTGLGLIGSLIPRKVYLVTRQWLEPLMGGFTYLCRVIPNLTCIMNGRQHLTARGQ